MNGVLVACDRHLEWLLAWWWESYSRANDYPVIFVDLGMGQEKKGWCKERGKVVSLEGGRKEGIKPVLEWEDSYGKSYPQARKAWFQKPLACLCSPFEITLWMDLDCEVLSSISPIFSVLSEGKEIAAAREINKEGVYNSGVLVFRKESLVVQEWARRCQSESELHWGDDRVLSLVIEAYSHLVEDLSPVYNWRMSDGVPFYAKIIHWCGEWGKTYIAKQGGFRKHLEQCPLLQELFELT